MLSKRVHTGKNLEEKWQETGALFAQLQALAEIANVKVFWLASARCIKMFFVFIHPDLPR